MATEPRTAREALVIQALEDIDGMLSRIEALGGQVETLVGQKTETAVKSAVGKAALEAEMRMAEMTRKATGEIMAACGSYTAQLREAMGEPAARALAGALSGRAAKLMALAVAVGVVAGATGAALVLWVVK